MASAWHGLVLGAAFGLTAGTVNLWFGMIVVVQRRLAAGPGFHLRTVLLEAALGALLGLLAAPLLRTRAGRMGHLLAVVLAWAALIKWAELDSPLFARVQYLPPTLGALLLVAGLWLARRRAWLPWALGAVVLAAGLAAPDLYLSLTTAPVERRTELPDPRPGAPDVVVVVLDTVRAESLSTYGYERPTSPRLDGLAREGVLFMDATSPSTWSLPSHASLFTGRYPSAHGAHMEHRTLDATFPTLADALALAGYETFCFTSNPWISDPLGLTRGFQFQDTHWRDGSGGRMFGFIHRLLAKLGFDAPDKGGGVVAAHFEEWVRQRPADARPAFVFLNFVEAHFPYHQLPDEYLTLFSDRSRGELRDVSLELMAAQFGGEVTDLATAVRDARDMYDAGVVYSDHLLGRVADALRARGSLDRTVFIMLGDHGELLGEKGGYFGHGPSLYQPMIRVPLYLRYPPALPAGQRVDAPVSTVGVYASILDLLGLEPPPTLQVGSLLPVIRGDAGPRAPVLAERFKASAMGVDFQSSRDPLMQSDVRYRAYRDGRWKIIDTSTGAVFLYDLVADPGEEHDLASERPQQLVRLRSALDEVAGELGLPPLDADFDRGAAPELDAETSERLKALGYLE